MFKRSFEVLSEVGSLARNYVCPSFLGGRELVSFFACSADCCTAAVAVVAFF